MKEQDDQTPPTPKPEPPQPQAPPMPPEDRVIKGDQPNNLKLE